MTSNSVVASTNGNGSVNLTFATFPKVFAQDLAFSLLDSLGNTSSSRYVYPPFMAFLTYGETNADDRRRWEDLYNMYPELPEEAEEDHYVLLSLLSEKRKVLQAIMKTHNALSTEALKSMAYSIEPFLIIADALTTAKNWDFAYLKELTKLREGKWTNSFPSLVNHIDKEAVELVARLTK